MEQTRDQQDKVALPQTQNVKAVDKPHDVRSEPQPLDLEVLKQVGGGTQAPHGCW